VACDGARQEWRWCHKSIRAGEDAPRPARKPSHELGQRTAVQVHHDPMAEATRKRTGYILHNKAPPAVNLQEHRINQPS